MTQQRYIAHFQPQTWINDNAVDVDAQDEQEWDCTFFLHYLDEHIDPDEVEDVIQTKGSWLDAADVLRDDPAAPVWTAAWNGPFAITVRHRTEYDVDIPQGRGAELVTPTAEKLLTAIESHRNEVYGYGAPNFVWDIQLYQDAGLLSEGYVGPDNDEISGSIYSMRKALEALIAAAEPVATKLVAGAYVHYMDAMRFVTEVTAAKQALAEHSTAKACTCSVHGVEVQDHD